MKSIQIKNEIEHDYTDEVVCPWCGYEHADSWERNMNNGSESMDWCEECGGQMSITCHIDVSYTTGKWDRGVIG